jgi:RHS repeat-associated protein
VQFDADGNMITGPLNGQMASYTYDSRNRLVAAGNLTYEYDAENNRIGVTEDVNGSPVKTEYVVNPQAALSQVLIKTVGNEQTYYVYGLGLIGQEVAGEYSSYHFDLRGSTVAITNANGKVTDRYQYSAYGEILSSSGNTDTPFLYNGRDGVMTDANGLYYMRARYYNPEIRRFVSQDTLLGVVINGQSLNRYAYCSNNPVNYVDSSGNSRVLALTIGGAIISGGTLLISDILNHRVLSWDTYLANIAGGAVGGFTFAITGNVFVASAATSAVSGGIQRSVEYARGNDCFDIMGYAKTVITDTLVGGVAGKIAGAVIPRGPGRTPKYLSTWLTGKIGFREIWIQGAYSSAIEIIGKTGYDNMQKGKNQGKKIETEERHDEIRVRK